MTKRHIIVATRESPLALCQTEMVCALLKTSHPHLSIELLKMTTTADKHLNMTLTTIGGKGLFVKELEEALLAGQADIAIHSMKDVPMSLPVGLSLKVMCKREEPRDAFLSNDYRSLAELPIASSIGTSSLRRQTQLRAIRSDLSFKLLRGNINTRLDRLDRGDFSAIILAGAGLIRMNLTARIRDYFSMDECLPSAGQGALGIECRENDQAVLALIEPLNHLPTYAAVTAERALCNHLGGGCVSPVAAYADIHQDVLTLRGLVSNRAGTRILRAKLTGIPEEAYPIGVRVAEVLRQQGAEDLLREFM